VRWAGWGSAAVRREAIAVALVGLAVNLVSALLLREHHDHNHAGLL
jgi:Co/Zn/Cd efflux system component